MYLLYHPIVKFLRLEICMRSFSEVPIYVLFQFHYHIYNIYIYYLYITAFKFMVVFVLFPNKMYLDQYNLL